MKKGLTELVFILDRSGSMAGLEQDTVGGFNSMLEKQKAVDGECTVTTVLFDNAIELLHDRLDLRAVAPITEREYAVGGATALLDAVGGTILKIDSALRHTAEDYRAENVLFVIITDGEENSSRSFTADGVRGLIRSHREKYGWEFIFLGANMDAVETASRYGIPVGRAQSYCADSRGVDLNFRVMANAVTSFRECCSLSQDWNAGIEQDMKNRGK